MKLILDTSVFVEFLCNSYTTELGNTNNNMEAPQQKQTRSLGPISPTECYNLRASTSFFSDYYHLWVVDMRDTRQYDEGHIDGASSLSFFDESVPSGEISEDGRATKKFRADKKDRLEGN